MSQGSNGTRLKVTMVKVKGHVVKVSLGLVKLAGGSHQHQVALFKDHHPIKKEISIIRIPGSLRILGEYFCSSVFNPVSSNPSSNKSTDLCNLLRGTCCSCV